MLAQKKNVCYTKSYSLELYLRNLQDVLLETNFSLGHLHNMKLFYL